MSPPLFLLPELVAGDVLELLGAEAHHAAVVRRLLPGETVLVADGRGAMARTQVLALSRDRVLLSVLERWRQSPREPRLVVVQALPKGERAELAVELLTELGVDEIVPWAASRSISVWRDDKAVKGVAKWRRVALEASKQSRRAWIPQVHELSSTGEVAALLRASAVALVLHEEASASLASVSLASVEISAGAAVVVVVGPEGGIAAEELADFTAAGAQVCKLGTEVMRTSTAGAAALAVLSVATGRWR